MFAAQADGDWGFAVFQLKPHAAPKRRWFRRAEPASPALSIHPMAFAFPTRRPRALFFPTLHVHDGATVPATPHYDHTLICRLVFAEAPAHPIVADAERELAYVLDRAVG